MRSLRDAGSDLVGVHGARDFGGGGIDGDTGGADFDNFGGSADFERGVDGQVAAGDEYVSRLLAGLEVILINGDGVGSDGKAFRYEVPFVVGLNVWESPVSSLVMVTLAFATTPPDLSVTVPLIVPKMSCERAC